MTTFRFSLLGVLLLLGGLVFLLMNKGSPESAARAAAAISAECGIGVQARRNEANGQLGLAIDPIRRLCRRPGDGSRIACARKRISESHFAEVDDPSAVICPDGGPSPL